MAEMQRRSILLLAGGGVLLVAGIGIGVGLGFSGSSQNDKIVKAYQQTLTTPESDAAAIRADALELANVVCRSTPKETAAGALDGLGASPEAEIAVAAIACPDVAAAIRAKNGLPPEPVSTAFCKLVDESQTVGTTPVASMSAQDRIKRLDAINREMEQAAPPGLQQLYKRLADLSRNLSGRTLSGVQQSQLAEISRQMGPYLASCSPR